MVEKLVSIIVLHPKMPASQVRAFAALLQVVRPAPRKFVVKRLVLDAVVAKILVEVELVVVLFTPVKFWKVEDAVARRLPKLPWPAAVIVPVKFADEELV